MLNPARSANAARSPSSDDEGDLPVFGLVNMTSRHPSLNDTSSLQNSECSSPLATVKVEDIPTVKQEDCSLPLGGIGEEVLGRRRHVGTGARRATGTSHEDPICLSESESDGDSGELGTDTSTPSSGTFSPSGGSPSSGTALERLPVPDSSPSNDTRVSLQRQFFGEQQVFVIDASRVGNVARFFNVSLLHTVCTTCYICTSSVKLVYSQRSIPRALLVRNGTEREEVAKRIVPSVRCCSRK